MAFGAATRQGNWPVQEDSYWMEPVWGSYVLGDGMGGKGVGDSASSTIVKQIGKGLVSRLQEKSKQDEEEKGYKRLSKEENQMRHALVGGNNWLLERNDKVDADERAAVSVVAAQFLPSGRVILGNAGACGAMVLRRGKAILILRPQTFAISQGHVSGACDERFGSDFALSGLGFYRELEPEIRTCHFHKSDILLLFTEGFMPGDENILKKAAVLSNSTEIAGQTLEEQALGLLRLSSKEQSCQRNASIILIDCSSSREYE